MSEAEEGMTKEEACRILQVAPAADAEIITQAYWHLARKYRAKAARDRRARLRLDELNQAYSVLHPASKGAPPPEEAPISAPNQAPLAEEFIAWLRRVIEQTRARWQGRVPEIAVLTATTAVLAFLALSAGASALWALLALAVALIAIWAPWRRT